MNALFGYRLEPSFNIDKEQRRARLNWPFYCGLVLCIIYLFLGKPYGTELFQAWVATSLFYGENFYVRRRDYLRKSWLLKALIASIPLHALYLAALFWSDRIFPQVMTKAIVFVPVLALGFAIESIQMDRLIDRFRLSSIDQSAHPN